MVVYIARKFENTGIHIEDLVSIGTIGLIKAVNTFDPSKNIKLATYASRCIENEILMYLRRTSKLKAEVSFDEPLNVDWDGNELVLADVVGSESDVLRHIEKEVDKALLAAALQQLTGREKKIMELRFGLNCEKERTQREVADLLGISQSYISRLEKKTVSYTHLLNLQVFPRKVGHNIFTLMVQMPNLQIRAQNKTDIFVVTAKQEDRTPAR